MSKQNGTSRFPPSAVAKSAGGVLQDVMTLVELQLKLLQVDARRAVNGMLLPGVLLLVAGCLLLGCLAVLLISLGFGLAALGMPTWLGMLLATVIGLAVTGGMTFYALMRMKKITGEFETSKEEFDRNIRWIKSVLKRETADRPMAAK